MILEIDFNNNLIVLGKCEIWRMEGGLGYIVIDDIDYFFLVLLIIYRELYLFIYDVLEV